MQNLPETYWSLVIESNWIQSAIWDIDESEKKARVISVSNSSHWESEDDLISAADSVLSSAASELPDENQEPTKTVFGVSASWVDGGQIKDTHLDKIRKICSSLSLEPSGFVVLPEAIAYFVKSNEGSPLSGIVAGIGNESIEISVFKLGSLIGNVVVARSVSIAEDIIEGLVRFKGLENLPSRVLLFDGKEGQLEEAKQALVTIDWLSPEISQKVKFLHIPKIEIIDPKDKVLAVCLAGASEIGQANSISFMENSTSDEEDVIPEVDKNFEESDVNPEDLGFVSGGDIRSGLFETSEEKPKEEIHHRAVTREEEIPFTREMPAVANLHLPQVPNLKLPKFKLPNLSFLIPPRFAMPRKGIIPTLIVLGFVVLASLLAFIFLPKATVTVYVSPKKIDSTETVTLGSGLSSRQEKLVVDGSKTVSVTGTKTVGDRAKGQVTVYNAADSLTLVAGTKIVDTAGNTFFLDEDTSIASGSGLLNLGTSSANVTAADIGSQYNLAAGANFSVNGYASNELTAKNDNAFSGGSSREITAVSASDLKKAEDVLSSQLKGDGAEKIKEKISEGDFLIEDSITATASGKDFNHKVGDEATDLKLTMKMDITGTVVSRDDLLKIASTSLNDKIPSGFVLRENQIVPEFSLVSDKKYKVKFTANLLPEIKTDDITKRISGKSLRTAQGILSSVAGYSRSEIKLSFRLIPTLPYMDKNITVELASEN